MPVTVLTFDIVCTFDVFVIFYFIQTETGQAPHVYVSCGCVEKLIWIGDAVSLEEKITTTKTIKAIQPFP